MYSPSMAFEVFQNSAGLQAVGPRATITLAGAISLNQEAVQKFGATHVLLTFDKQLRAIALQPTTPDDPNGYPIRPVYGGRSGVISAKAFLQHFEVPLNGARRWEAHLVNGALQINLNEPSAPAGRERTTRVTTARYVRQAGSLYS